MPGKFSKFFKTSTKNLPSSSTYSDSDEELNLDESIDQSESFLYSCLSTVSKEEKLDEASGSSVTFFKGKFLSELYNIESKVKSLISAYSYHDTEEKEIDNSSYCDALLLSSVDNVLEKLKKMQKSISDLLPLNEKTNSAELSLYSDMIIKQYNATLNLLEKKLTANLQIALATYLEDFISQQLVWSPQVQDSPNKQSIEAMNKKIAPLLKCTRTASDKENDDRNPTQSSPVFFHLPKQEQEIKKTERSFQNTKDALARIKALKKIATKECSKGKEVNADALSNFYVSLHSLEKDKLSNAAYLYQFIRNIHIQRMDFQKVFKASPQRLKIG